MWHPAGPFLAPRANPRRAPLWVPGALVAAWAALVLGAVTPARAAAPVEVVHPDQGHDHIPNPEFPHAPYVSNPPTSGPHTAYTAPWGRHAEPVPNEILVHNLEHGGVVIGYRCADCPGLADRLATLAEGFPLVVVAPNPDLPAPVVLSAWGRTLSIETLDDDARRAIRDFLRHHHGVDHHPMGHRHTVPADPPPGPDP